MEISVEVSEVTLDSIVHEAEGYRSQTIADMVVETIVARVAKDRDHWDSIFRRVREVRDEEIRKQVVPLIEQALAEPFRVTNNYGESAGPETTLRELIIREAKETLVRKQENPRTGLTVVQQIVQDQVRAAFTKEVAQEVARAKETISTEIGSLVGAAVKKAMTSR